MSENTTTQVTDEQWTDGTDEPTEETVETPAPTEKPKFKVPESLKVRVALAITFSPKDFGIPETVKDLNEFRWAVRAAVKDLIENDERFTLANADTVVMPD